MIWSSARFWQKQENVILSSTVTKFNSILTKSSIWVKLLVNWASHLTQKKSRLFITWPHPYASKTYKLQGLLGMIIYLSKYIPNMSELTAALRSLHKGDVSWAWFPEHDSALTKIKTVLSSAPVLRFYDTSFPNTLQVDATKNGLGTCLMQQGQPVTYASRALSNSERNYAPIEKEMLAIVFGCKRYSWSWSGSAFGS